jgi:prophage regulatory protein
MVMMCRLETVKQRRGIRSNATLYGQIKQGLFTRPIRIGARAVAWLDSEIDAINRAQAAGKSNDEIRALVERLHADRATACAANTAGVQQ